MMTESELVIQTIANGEAMFGVWDFDKEYWRIPPRTAVFESGGMK